MKGNACLHRRFSLDAAVTKSVLIFASATAMAVPTWLERMLMLMHQTVQQSGIAPKPKPLAEPDPIQTTQASQQIFTGPKGGVS